MLRLIFSIVLFLIFEIPIISNAAGIYDNSLKNVDKKKNEKLENINANEINLLNDNRDKIASEYDIELLSILKKNTMIQKIQNKPLSYQQYYLTSAGRSGYTQFISNNGIDVLTLLETEMGWKEIKADLNYSIIIFNRIDIWAKNFLDERIDTNYVLSTDVNSIRQPKRKRNLYENQNIFSSMIYQNDTHYKHQDGYKISSSYNDKLNSVYEDDNGDEQNRLSLIYGKSIQML